MFDEAAAKAVLDDFKAHANEDEWPGMLVDEVHYSLDREKSAAVPAAASRIVTARKPSPTPSPPSTVKSADAAENH